MIAQTMIGSCVRLTLSGEVGTRRLNGSRGAIQVITRHVLCRFRCLSRQETKAVAGNGTSRNRSFKALYHSQGSDVGRVFRLLADFIAVGGLALQFWLMMHYPSARSLSTVAMHFLSFFTIQTNILIALCMLVPAITPNARLGQGISNPSARTAVMAYSAITAIVYYTLLRNIGHDDGLERRADQVLH